MATERAPTASTSPPSQLVPPAPTSLRHHFHAKRVAAVFEQVGRPTTGGVTWLWARTDLDIATVTAAHRELATLVAGDRNPGNVLVYLGPERFVDLRGLRLLVDTARRARSRGGALAVVAPPRCVRRMVRLARLDTELPLVATARQAVWWTRTRGTGLL